MIRLGDVFYDERNGRYLTVTGQGTDPKCYSCQVEEMNDEGEYEVVDMALFMQGELEKMDRR